MFSVAPDSPAATALRELTAEISRLLKTKAAADSETGEARMDTA